MLFRSLRTAGRWIAKIRRVSGHFRTGVETMIREAELEEMEQKWREQNAKIIAESGAAEPVAEAVPPAPSDPVHVVSAPLPPPP